MCCDKITLYQMTSLFFFFNDTATTEIYTLSLHDALPISMGRSGPSRAAQFSLGAMVSNVEAVFNELLGKDRSEEHTSELQSRPHLVCRLLLDQKLPSTSMHRTAT